MKKKFARLMLVAIVGTMGVTFSSFLAPSEDTNHMQTYYGPCANGSGTITVCGSDGPGCTPAGHC